MITQPPPFGCPFPIDAAASDIHREAGRLRAQGPAARVVLPGGVEAWSVTDPGLIARLLTDRRVSKDAYQHWPPFIDGEIPEQWPLRIWAEVRSAFTAYGPDHTRLRRLIGTAFTIRRVRAMEPLIKDVTEQVLDDLTARRGPAGAPVDLRDEFAWVLPLRVVNTLLGVPSHLHDRFRECVGVVFATDVSGEAAAANSIALYELLEELVETKRRQPGDDVTSELIHAHDTETDSRLSHQELVDNLLLLIGAGHETTVNLIGHAVVDLLTHPDQLTLVRDVGTTATWDDVVEETLRHQAPIASIIPRFPVEDIHDEDTGLVFGRGELIVVNYAAANRDPHQHAVPDRFDIARPTRTNHQAFGVGAHHCLGAGLARLEVRIALSALFSRFPDLALAVPPEELRPVPSFISNGHQSIPVHLNSAAPARL